MSTRNNQTKWVSLFWLYRILLLMNVHRTIIGLVRYNSYHGVLQTRDHGIKWAPNKGPWTHSHFSKENIMVGVILFVTVNIYWMFENSKNNSSCNCSFDLLSLRTLLQSCGLHQTVETWYTFHPYQASN